MSKNNKIIRNRYAYRSIIAIFICVFAFTGVSCFQYYSRLQTTIRQEGSGYLQEVSNQIGTNVNRIINDNYAVLNTMATVLVHSKADSFSAIRPVIEAQQSYWHYQDVMLIDESGLAYNLEGKEMTLSSDVYLRNTVLGRKQSMSTSQMVDNKECVIFAIPVTGIKIAGKEMAALAASYESSNFDEALSMSSFGGKAYSHIISQTGTVIVRSTLPSASSTGYNVLNTLEAAKLDDGSSMSELKNNIEESKSGQISYTLDGIRNYMVYSPINTEGWYLITFVPVDVVNQKSDMMLKVTLFISGLITLVFSSLLAFILYIYFRNKKKLEQIAYVDEVTGGHTIQKFYELAQGAVDKPEHIKYALVYTNLEKFKVINEEFGRKTGDALLCAFHNIINEGLSGEECVGRLSGDNFCLLMEYRGEPILEKRFKEWYTSGEVYAEGNKPVWTLPITEFGVFVVDNDTMPFPQMIDRAKLALKESGRSIGAKLRYAVYDDQVRRRMVREKQLEDMMEGALLNNEFEVYLQPKYRVNNETIGGAEALSRWKNPAEGMIYPDEFIPLFERNGFIIQLDLWVFEQVCISLRKWLNEGKVPVKISINCSRMHLKDKRFLKSYQKISSRYKIPENLLEIELTESVVMENTEQLTKIIEDIHEAGYGCSMDDFGSGYSSLNLIQEIPVDVLKLDKIFFRNSKKDSKRMKSVVSSIITMAEALNMETVAEGVEYREQVDMLKEMNCDYIQGYVFAKPMPISDFEYLLFGENHS